MSAGKMSIHDYSLDIQTYSFQDLLNLFDLSNNITVDDLKRAKKKVLMLHPDKSRLDAKFFLFYKKAFEKIVNYYNELNKQNQKVIPENTVYNIENPDKNIKRNIDKTMQKTDQAQFQTWFNAQFEQNVVKKQQPKNDWFRDDSQDFTAEIGNVNANNIHATFESLREKKCDIIPFRDVETLNSATGTNYFEEDEEDNNTYISSDPFSKLKFDDLRKVHKEETIFSVGEKDFSKIKQYSSMDQYIQERGSQKLQPMQKSEAELYLQRQEEEFQKKQLSQQFKSNLKTDQYEELNKQIIAKFLRLEN